VTLPDRPWFETDDYEAYIARSGFDAETAEFVRHMARQGYAAVDLGEEARALCDRAVADTARYFKRPGIGRVQDAWYRSRAIRRLAAWPRMRELLKAAYGRDPFPFQTLNFLAGSQQPLHADTVHFNSVPERFMCGVWIALEDVEPGAGPLVYHPGSHKLPVMTMRDAGVNSDRPTPEDYERSFVPRFAERIAAGGFPAEHAILKKGWAFVWAANLAHGGSAITKAGSTRRSLVVHCYFEDCLYYTPMTSDEAAGRYDLRVPANVRTGLWTWPRRDGRPAHMRWKRVFGGVLRDVLRWPYAN
jgi:hypothetical protein